MRREGEGKGRKGGRGGSGYYWDISSGCCDGENDAIDANSSVLCVCVCVCHSSVIAPINKLAVSCMQLCVCVCVRTCVCVCLLHYAIAVRRWLLTCSTTPGDLIATSAGANTSSWRSWSGKPSLRSWPKSSIW